uniref:Uncharacterized protein n=1 Tax=Aegilops tauschii subsp. strangulata TaxID=200361 RepID=A0A453RD49_AEGTS
MHSAAAALSRSVRIRLCSPQQCPSGVRTNASAASGPPAAEPTVLAAVPSSPVVEPFALAVNCRALMTGEDPRHERRGPLHGTPLGHGAKMSKDGDAQGAREVSERRLCWSQLDDENAGLNPWCVDFGRVPDQTTSQQSAVSTPSPLTI